MSVPGSIANPRLDFRTNALGTLTLLEQARKSDIGRFVYTSSAAVYGAPKYVPIDEEHPTAPLSPYGISKLTGERYCLLNHSQYGVPTVSLRLFNVFGPGQRDNQYAGVIKKFLTLAGRKQAPTIYGNGRQTRDFVHVSDVVHALLLARKRKAAVGQVMNIGTGKETSINRLADVIARIANLKKRPVHLPAREGDISRSVAKVERARRLLGFEARVSLEEGLREMLTS